jgi:hypothetical protein
MKLEKEMLEEEGRFYKTLAQFHLAVEKLRKAFPIAENRESDYPAELIDSLITVIDSTGTLHATANDWLTLVYRRLENEHCKKEMRDFPWVFKKAFPKRYNLKLPELEALEQQEQP